VHEILFRRNIVQVLGVVTLEPAALSHLKSIASEELLMYGGFGLVQELCEVWSLAFPHTHVYKPCSACEAIQIASFEYYVSSLLLQCNRR
jgi:hypothetical protein